MTNMSPATIQSHGPSVSDATMGRGVSIGTKLFLMIVGLLAAVTFTGSLDAFRAMNSATLQATSARLDGIATQWSTLFAGSVKAEGQLLSSAGQTQEIRAVLTRPDATTRAAAIRALTLLLPPGRNLSLQLVDASGSEIVSAGRIRRLSAPESATLRRAASMRETSVIGPLRAAGETVLSAAASRVLIDGTLRGFLILSSQLQLTPSPDQINRLFGGGNTRARLANRDGSVWSDLARPIAAPSVDLSHTEGFIQYQSAGGDAVFASVRSIAGTPWMFVLESSQDEVLMARRAFLRGRWIGGMLVLLFGGFGAYLLSSSLTAPLGRLSNAVEAIADGDYATRLPQSQRSDEIGRLNRSLNGMVAQVQESFAATAAAEAYYRQLFASVPLPVWAFDRETLRILDVNDAAIAHYGYSREEFLAMTLADLRPAQDVPDLLADLAKSDSDRSRRSEWRHIKRDGSVIDVETSAHAIEFRGRPARIAVIHDVTERNATARNIARLEENNRQFVRESPYGIAWSAPDGGFLAANPAFVAMLGFDSEEQVLSMDPGTMYESAEARAELVAKITAFGRLHRHEVRLKRKDGSLISVRFTARFVADSVTGAQVLEATTEDVTEQRKVELQFHQAQKMDAIGQLAAGVAHDFNNLLTVIMSYSSILLAELPEADPHRAEIESIRAAGASASSLTRQLLIFSRQKVVQPEAIRLDEVVSNAGKMLERLIGEHVELAVALGAGLGAVRIDAGQTEQIIINLAVNARDAMPNGGRILIELKSIDYSEEVTEGGSVLPAGRYVMLSVSDNGIGMDIVTQQRVFEPFFTTKPLGRGTGLGLATVYGIVQQSGGFISLYSEIGVGTTFKIFFPRLEESTDVRVHSATRVPVARGSETVLLVEDEAAIRMLVRRVLEKHGYSVLEAPDGVAALDIASRHKGAIELLLTDVVMPRLGGRSLADRFVAQRPGVRILYMSGYTDDAIVHQAGLGAGIQLLEKPFTGEQLASKVRRVLDLPVAAAQRS